MNTPVLLFTYNRPEHTRRTLQHLNANNLCNQTKLFIFSDGPKTDGDEQVTSVREIIRQFEKNNNFEAVEIFESERNRGLANSIISGVAKVIHEYGRVIVLEDDLLSTPDFIEYMNRALDFYAENKAIWSIAGYSPILKSVKRYPHDVYMCARAGSWGWGTWQDRWDMVDWQVSDYQQFREDREARRRFEKRSPGLVKMLDMQMNGELDSWAIRWCYQQFKEQMYTVNPCYSKIQNIGLDGSGTHCGKTNKWSVELQGTKEVVFENLKINKKIMREYNHYYIRTFKQRVRNRIVRMLGRMH